MTSKTVVSTCAVLAVSAGHGVQKPLDFWDEQIRLFGVAAQNQHVDADLAKRRAPNYWYHRPSAGFELDHSDKRVGDLSIRYTPAGSDHTRRFGFVADLWGGAWSLSPNWTLRLWLKVEGEKAPGQWDVILVDYGGNTARGTLTGTATNGQWQERSLPLDTLELQGGFDWTRVKLCEFEAPLGADVRIWLDGIGFEGPKSFIGVTDKPLAQRMAEASTSRRVRIEAAFELAARDDSQPVVAAFAKMYLNQDLEEANRALAEELEKSEVAKDSWSLLHTPLYCRIYYWFSKGSGKLPGRMEPEVEKRLLEVLWQRTNLKNDIHWARQSTWWLEGSENHDLNAKASNLVTARIFMDEPQYRDRVYPDKGFGGAYNYGHAGYYGEQVDLETRLGGGRADLADGEQYTARDHYYAWLAYLKEYFRQRARRGFFVENASHIYSKHTLNMVDLAYQYGGDDELQRLVGDFLSLYWADWAQKSISGVHGGPKTRHHGSVGGYDGTCPLISFYMGGPGSGGVWSYWSLINDYRLPAIVWRMALDRQGMGSFVYRARGIGEEENVWPRPLGTERTLTCDTEARFLKYTYVTPDYTLGTQMDHPAAVHSHLSVSGRWHGMTFAQSPGARIVPVGIPASANILGKVLPFDTETTFRTAQHEHTLVLQQARRWLQIDPDWFPSYGDRYERQVAIHLGNDWDRKEERSGWVFVQKGSAYAGVRPVLWDQAYERAKASGGSGTQKVFDGPRDDSTVKLRQDSYRWNEDHTMILLEDRFSPVIIQAGRRDDHPDLEAFMADVLDYSIALYKTVVPGFNQLVYGGEGGPEIVFNAANSEIPRIGGKPIDYSHGMTFDSPYLKSVYQSGTIEIQYGDERLELNFSAEP